VQTEPVEVACDESGSEGENLVAGNTDVFAHASVRLAGEPAAACVRELRARIRSPAVEYKAGHLLREKHRPVLEWLLGPAGPILGQAHVHLTDKAFFVVGRLVDLLLGDAAADTAATLYREGRRGPGRRQWRAFLESSNDLLRGRTSLDAFRRAVDQLRPAMADGPAGDLLGRLRRAGPPAGPDGARPPLDPLIPALVRAVAYWGGGGRPVAIVHDQHTALTAARVARLGELPGGRLASLRLVDSRSDPRVQVADFLAGVARKLASDELNGRGDARLTGLLRPYVDASSIWGDQRSWSLLAPAPA
jgi:hypothetical protein